MLLRGNLLNAQHLLKSIYKFDRSNLLYVKPCCINGVMRSKHQITYKPYEPEDCKDHDRKNMCIGRPMSPHLTVTTLTVSAFTSVLQRGTGAILSFSAFTLAVFSLCCRNGPESYMHFVQSFGLGSFSAFIIKFLFGLPFTLHYMQAIKYLFFYNRSKMLTLCDIVEPTKKIFAVSAVLAFLFAII